MQVQTSTGAGGSPAGALVAGVEPGTPAAGAGLTAGDTITSVDGTAVGSASALTSVLGTHHPGDKVTVALMDAAGRSHATSVTLATGPVK